ncbi:hypothetical protein D3C87_236820 [compost metagenome]
MGSVFERDSLYMWQIIEICSRNLRVSLDLSNKDNCGINKVQLSYFIVIYYTDKGFIDAEASRKLASLLVNQMEMLIY